MRQQRTAKGFSLIELMLVIAIIGALMGVAAFAMVGQGEKAKTRATEASMKTISVALDSYKLDYNMYPPSIETLVSTSLLRSVPSDGWDRPFYYSALQGGATYALISSGSDGQTNTPDDIDAATALD